MKATRFLTLFYRSLQYVLECTVIADFDIHQSDMLIVVSKFQVNKANDDSRSPSKSKARGSSKGDSSFTESSKVKKWEVCECTLTVV